MKVEFTPEQERLRQELRAYFKALITPELDAELEESPGEGGGPLWKAAMRQVLILLGACVITYSIGKAFGVSVS